MSDGRVTNDIKRDRNDILYNVSDLKYVMTCSKYLRCHNCSSWIMAHVRPGRIQVYTYVCTNRIIQYVHTYRFSGAFLERTL